MKKKDSVVKVGEGRPVTRNKYNVNEKLYNVIERVLAWLFIVSGLFGLLISLRYCFFEEGSLNNIFPTMCVIAALFILAFELKKKTKGISVVVWITIIFLFTITNIADLIIIIKCAVYYIKIWVCWYNNWEAPVKPDEIGRLTPDMYDMMSFVVVFPWLVCMSIAWRRNGSAIWGVVATTIYFGLLFWSGYMPEILSLALITISTVGLAFKERSKSVVTYNKNVSVRVIGREIAFLGICVGAVFFAKAVSGSMIEKILPLQDWVYDNFSEEGGSGKPSPGGDVTSSSGVSGGKTGKGGNLVTSKEEVFKISSSLRIPHSTYLKAYVADTYDGEGWVNKYNPYTYEHCDGRYDLISLENEFISREKIVLTSYDEDFGLEDIVYTNALRISLPPEKVKRSDYVLFPYCSWVAETDGTIADGYYLLNSTGSSRFAYSGFQFKGGYGPGEKDGFFEFIKRTKQFQGTIYKETMDEAYSRACEYYTEVPDFLSRIKEDYGSYVWTDYEDAITYVQNKLSDGFRYTQNPGATPSDKDYIEYFLYENKKGYCMYYASAAVMMFRSMGIPARYVEGYLVGDLPKDTEVSVKGYNAHAWAEIFIKDFGWIPVEVTNARLTSSGFVPETSTNKASTTRPSTVRPSESSSTTTTSRPSSSSVNKPGQPGTASASKPAMTSGEEEQSGTRVDIGKIVLAVLKYLLIALAIVALPIVIYGIILWIYYLIMLADKRKPYRKRVLSCAKRMKAMSRRSEAVIEAEGDWEAIRAFWNISVADAERIHELFYAAAFAKRGITAEDVAFAHKIEENIMRGKMENMRLLPKIFTKNKLRIRRKINAGK